MDRRLMGEMRLALFAFLATVTLSLVGAGLIIGQALLLSRAVDRAFLQSTGREDLRTIFLGLLAVVLLRALIQGAIQITAAEIAIRIKQDLRRRLIDHLIRLGPSFTQRERSGELTLTATDGVDALEGYFRDYIPALFTAVLIPLAILTVVLPLDLLTFGVLLLTAPLIPIFMILIGMAAGALARSRYAQLGQMSAHFLDVMQGLTTLKLFNRSKAQIEIIAEISEHYRQSTLAVLRVAFLSAFALELLATISVAIVAVEIGLRLLYGGLAFEQALFLLVIAPEFYMPLRQLGAKFHAGQDGTAAAARIFAILDTPTSSESGMTKVPDFDQIRFDNVSVSFEDGERTALRDFALTIHRGEHIALVGATGSGKSTVANLLLRFAQPTAGGIVLDGAAGRVPLADVKQDAWREQIAWVSQRGYLFNLSVADNIRIGAPNATQDQIVSAAQVANAHDFIVQLPRGYNTVLGENAERLSGGQAQRIVLARALLQPRAIYIFDEATANLDRANEAAIQAGLATLRGTATVLTIAHRLDTIRHADRIVVLDGGRIAEIGAHDELIVRRGAYFALLQAFGEGV